MTDNHAFPHYPRRDENTGHGHIYRRPDGNVMRCGALHGCPACVADALEAATTWCAATLDDQGEIDEVRAATALLTTAGQQLLAQRDAAIGANVAALARQESSFGSQGLFQPMPTTY